MPPCFTGNVVTSPAAKTPGNAEDAPAASRPERSRRPSAECRRFAARAAGAAQRHGRPESRRLTRAAARRPETRRGAREQWMPIRRSSSSFCTVLARVGAEDAQRRLFRRHERELHVVQPAFGEPRRRQQRQLVDRQRPDRARRHGEDDTAHVTGFDLREQPLDSSRCPPGRGRSARRGSSDPGTAPQAIRSAS